MQDASDQERKADVQPWVDPVRKRRAVIEEGIRCGAEIKGAADDGDQMFVSISVDEATGDVELLVDSVKAMNLPFDSTGEGKGGSGHTVKMVFSAGADQLAIVVYIAGKRGDGSCEWLFSDVLDMFGGKIVGAAGGYYQGVIVADSDNNLFPSRIREAIALEVKNFLSRKEGRSSDGNGSDAVALQRKGKVADRKSKGKQRQLRRKAAQQRIRASSRAPTSPPKRLRLSASALARRDELRVANSRRMG
mmetsp:Transcript_87820/g.223531  ORF Transcript_87820/g.223531 Transcript_87820/m.223531 type:complete len:248 (-) Transcript_87820:307-1050(-)